jgi:hypothetical protein
MAEPRILANRVARNIVFSFIESGWAQLNANENDSQSNKWWFLDVGHVLAYIMQFCPLISPCVLPATLLGSLFARRHTLEQWQFAPPVIPGLLAGQVGFC